MTSLGAGNERSHGRKVPAGQTKSTGLQASMQTEYGKSTTTTSSASASSRKRLVMTEDVYFLTTQRANAMETNQFIVPDTLLSLRFKARHLAHLAFGPKSLPALCSEVAVIRTFLLTGRTEVAEQKLQMAHSACIEAIRNLDETYGEDDGVDAPPSLMQNNDDSMSRIPWVKSDEPPDVSVYGADRLVIWATRKQHEALLEEIVFLMAATCVSRVRELAQVMTEAKSHQIRDARSVGHDHASQPKQQQHLEHAIAYAKAAQSRLRPLCDVHESRLANFQAQEDLMEQASSLTYTSTLKLRSLTVLIACQRLQLWLHAQRGRPGHGPVLDTSTKLLDLLTQIASVHAATPVGQHEASVHPSPLPVPFPLVLDVYILSARTRLALARECEKKIAATQLKSSTENDGASSASDVYHALDAEIEVHLTDAYHSTTQALMQCLNSKIVQDMRWIKDILPPLAPKAGTLYTQPSDFDSSSALVIEHVPPRVMRLSVAEDYLLGQMSRPDIAMLRTLGDICKLRAQVLVRLAGLRGKAQEQANPSGSYNETILRVHNPVVGISEPHARSEALEALDCWSSARALLSLTMAGLAAKGSIRQQIFVNTRPQDGTPTELASSDAIDATEPQSTSILTSGAWDAGFPGATWTVLNANTCAQVLDEAKTELRICDVYIIELLLALGNSAHAAVIQVVERLTMAAEEEAGCTHAAPVATALERVADVFSAVGQPHHARRAFLAALTIHQALRPIGTVPLGLGTNVSSEDFHAKAIQSIRDALKTLPGGDVTPADPFDLLSELNHDTTPTTRHTQKPKHPSTSKLTPHARLIESLSRLAERKAENRPITITTANRPSTARTAQKANKDSLTTVTSTVGNDLQSSKSIEDTTAGDTCDGNGQPPSYKSAGVAPTSDNLDEQAQVVSAPLLTDPEERVSDNSCVPTSVPPLNLTSLPTVWNEPQLVDDDIVFEDAEGSEIQTTTSQHAPPPPQPSSGSPRISVSTRRKFNQGTDDDSNTVNESQPEDFAGWRDVEDPFL